MSISKIAAEDLTHMSDTEGLILQGCGGDLQEWLDGINGILTDEKILRNDSKFEDIYTFENNGLSNLRSRLTMILTSTSVNLRCGDCRHTINLQENGFPIMLTIISAGSFSLMVG